jgi:uncharacterized protein YbjT (DUF2867 family)
MATTMSRLLVIFAATGEQGGSVLSHVLKDAQLSKQYKVRATTRDPSSSSSQALKKMNVEVIKADLTDTSSLHTAIKRS